MIFAPPCFTVFTVQCGLNSVAGVRAYVVWRTLDDYSSRKEQFYSHQSTECLCHFSLGQSTCSLANFSIHAVFSTMDSYGGFLLIAWSGVFWSSGNFRSSPPERSKMISWICPSIHINCSCCVSGCCCHFKAFEIILAELPIICFTSLYVFPSPINFLIKLCCSFEHRLEWPILCFFNTTVGLDPSWIRTWFIVRLIQAVTVNVISSNTFFLFSCIDNTSS